MTAAITKEQAIAIGGNEWNGTRVYFNSLIDLADGVEINFYGTGNVSGASIDGVGISNTKGRAIVSELSYGKVWFDIETGKLKAKNLSEDTAARIFRGIRARLAT